MSKKRKRRRFPTPEEIKKKKEKREEESDEFQEEDIFPTRFKLRLDRIDIVLEKPDDPVPWECYLLEMRGTERDAFLQSQKGVVNSQTREILKFKDLQTALIARSLHDLGTNELIPAEEIREFPSKVQSTLYDMCIELNALDEKAEEAEKNA